MVGFVNSFPYTKEICSVGWVGGWVGGWGGRFDVRIKGWMRWVGLFLFFIHKVSLML